MSIYETNIVATCIHDSEDRLELAMNTPGAYWFYDGSESNGILYSCPCGCGMIGSAPTYRKTRGPCWRRTGSRDRLTLSPSVGIRPSDNPDKPEWGTKGPDGFHWHGWLRDGVWVSC